MAIVLLCRAFPAERPILVHEAIPIAAGGFVQVTLSA